MRIFLLVLAIMGSACSAIVRPEYYKFRITPGRENSHVESDYRGQYFSIPLHGASQGPDYEYISIGVRNYAEKVYTMGPIFLPIIPVFFITRFSSKLDKSARVVLSLCAFGHGASQARIPAPSIELPGGRQLTPLPETYQSNGGSKLNRLCRELTYDVPVEGVKEFYLSESTFEFPGQRFVFTPKVKFIFTNDVQVDWAPALAP